MSTPHVVGHRGTADREASGLDAGADQVGADDDGAAEHRQGRRRDAGRSVRFRRRATSCRTRRSIRASPTMPACSTTWRRTCGTVVAARVGRGSAAPWRVSGSRSDPADLNLPSIGVGDLVGTKTVHRTVTNVGRTRRPTRRRCQDAAGLSRCDVRAGQLHARDGRIGDIRGHVHELTTRPRVNGGSAASPGRTASTQRAQPDRRQCADADRADGDRGRGRRRQHVIRRDLRLQRRRTRPACTGSWSRSSRSGIAAAGRSGQLRSTSVPARVHPGLPCRFRRGRPMRSGRLYDAVHRRRARLRPVPVLLPGRSDLPLPVRGWELQLHVRRAGQRRLPDETTRPVDDPYILFCTASRPRTGRPRASLFDWTVRVPARDDGNMTVTGPASAVIGETGTVDVSWAGLTTGPGAKQVGAISHNDATGPIDADHRQHRERRGRRLLRPRGVLRADCAEERLNRAARFRPGGPFFFGRVYSVEMAGQGIVRVHVGVVRVVARPVPRTSAPSR